MNIRQVARKQFGSVDSNKSVVYFGVPICIQIRGDTGDDLVKDLEKLGMEQKPLSQLSLIGKDFEKSIDTAKEMFSYTDPVTGESDVTGEEFYASYIPKGILGGILVPQKTVTGDSVFNGNGTVSIAEFLDSLNAIEHGINSDVNRSLSLDKISNVDDFFNEGYNLCCWGYSSPFFNLYTREELLKPITRLELSYIIVCCSGLYKSVFGSYHGIGISFNWLEPFDYVSSFKDWNKYRVSLIQAEPNVPEFSIKKYMKGRTVTEFLDDIKSGKSAIPMPMLMSLVDMGVQDLFYFEQSNLSPMMQVSRGELCYVLTRLVEKDK